MQTVLANKVCLRAGTCRQAKWNLFYSKKDWGENACRVLQIKIHKNYTITYLLRKTYLPWQDFKLVPSRYVKCSWENDLSWIQISLGEAISSEYSPPHPNIHVHSFTKFIVALHIYSAISYEG